MSYIEKISSMRKLLLNEFAKLVNEKYPNTISSSVLSEWKSLSKDRRRSRIATFLENSAYSQESLKELNRELNKLLWKRIMPIILIFIAAALIIYLGFNYNTFSKLRRVYVLENNYKIVFGTGKSEMYSFLGQSQQTDSTFQNSKHVLLFNSEKGDKLIVQDESFFDWLFGIDGVTLIDSNKVITDEATYEEYKQVFSDFKTNKYLYDLTVEEKRIIYQVQKDPLLKGYRLVGSVPVAFDNYKPFEIISYPNHIKYLFLCFKRFNDYKNVRVTFNSNINSRVSLEIITATGNKVWDKSQLMWLKVDPQIQLGRIPPQVFFRDTTNQGPEYAYIPPGEKFPFLKKH
jgi:hypothetical protein